MNSDAGGPGVDRDGVIEPVPGEQAVPGSEGGGPVVRSGADVIPGQPGEGRRGRRGGRRGGGRGRAERAMVPDATFTSYYGRPVVKPSPWEADIPVYLFLGGLAAGSSLLGAGGDLTGRPGLRRVGRIAGVGAISVSFAALVHDLGRPSKFVNMLRIMKPTSPMSVGTWLLTLYGPLAGIAGAAEVSGLLPAGLHGLRVLRLPLRLLEVAGRPAGIAAAFTAPPIAAYTAVLLSDTATPSWHDARHELPFVFVGSASAAAGGLGLALASGDVSPARRLAVGGALLELLAEHRMESTMGLTAEPLHAGRPGQLMNASKALTAGGAALAVLGSRSSIASRLAGPLLVAGSICTRFGIFHAGQESAKDPKYTVVPQRERLDRDGPSRG